MNLREWLESVIGSLFFLGPTEPKFLSSSRLISVGEGGFCYSPSE